MDISIHDKPVRVVLDTGADMSVLPRDVLLQLLPNIHLEPPTQVAQAFGGEQLLLEGPYHLMVTICQYTCCGASSLLRPGRPRSNNSRDGLHQRRSTGH